MIRPRTILSTLLALGTGCAGQEQELLVCDFVEPDRCVDLGSERRFPGPCTDGETSISYEDGRVVGLAFHRNEEERADTLVEYADDGRVARVEAEALVGPTTISVRWAFDDAGSERIETRTDPRFSTSETTRTLYAVGFRLDGLDLIWQPPLNGEDRVVWRAEQVARDDAIEAQNTIAVEYQTTMLADGGRRIHQRQRSEQTGSVVARATFEYDGRGRIAYSERHGDRTRWAWDEDRVVARYDDDGSDLVEYLYDRAGNRRGVQGPDGVSLYDYACWE